MPDPNIFTHKIPKSGNRAITPRKTATASPDTKEMSPSQKLDRFYGKKAPDGTEGPRERWRPSRPDDRHAQSATLTPALASRTAAVRGPNGRIEDPTLTAAREAEQARRTALENKSAGLVQRIEFCPEDFQAVMTGWIVINSTENGGPFFPSEWNATMLDRCVYYQVMSGQPGWEKFGISQLNAAHQYLAANGYYETERHHRGQAAPKEYPVYDPAPPQPEPTRSGNKSVFIRRDETSDAENRAMDFETLKKKATSTYKPENR